MLYLFCFKGANENFEIYYCIIDTTLNLLGYFEVFS